MTDVPRYAIYYTPDADTALARFGAAMLGYDARTGDSVPFPDGLVASAPDWHDLTRDPRKYGFHATLKAPFALADGLHEPQLLEACARFADLPRDIPVIVPAVRAIDGFIAIVPTAPSVTLNALAQDCVEAFDACRAPLTPADRARRKPEALTARQVSQLDRWGYPYVLEDFRFHMTLTGRLSRERRVEVLALSQQRFAMLGVASLAIDRIALFRQDEPAAKFRVVRSFRLDGAG